VRSDEATAALLWEVLTANSSMHATAQCVQLIEDQLDYPIASVAHLLPVVERHGGETGRLSVGSFQVSAEDVRRNLPPHFFPIEGRQALICVLLGAFEGDRLRPILSGSSRTGSA
jgi:hypothetical protein